MLLMSPFAFGEPKDLVTLEYFAALPKFSTPKLSPNIKRIASTITYQGKPLLVVQPINPEDDKIQEQMTPINAGERKRVVKNRIGAQHWIADTQGVVLKGVKIDTGHHQGVTIYYRDKKSSDWEKLQKDKYFSHDQLYPWRFDRNDENILSKSGQSKSDRGHHSLD
jgi:hypothetical protein